MLFAYIKTPTGETPRYDNRCRHLRPEEVQEKENDGSDYVIRLKVSIFHLSLILC